MAVSATLRILVIDDDPDVRFTIQTLLQKLGFKNIKLCASAKDSLSYIHEKLKDKLPVPEFIMCDYDMPTATGIDMFQALQKRPETAHIPFLLISGLSDKSFIIEAKNIGIKHILLKPFTQQTLVKEIARILN